MSDQERRLKMHEAICRCHTCRGSCDKKKLYPPCRTLDDLIDQLATPSAEVAAQ